MDQPLTQEESYVSRRKLFKDIWDAAMDINNKDGEVINKPKVIKTLRLDEVDHSVGKRKKQKIKNLRTVCNKILDFCDLQEAEDLYYKQMAVQKNESKESNVTDNKKSKIKPKKKKKTGKATKKCIKRQTTITDTTTAKIIVEEDQTPSKFIDKVSRSVSPIKIRHASNNKTQYVKNQFTIYKGITKRKLRKDNYNKGNSYSEGTNRIMQFNNVNTAIK